LEPSLRCCSAVSCPSACGISPATLLSARSRPVTFPQVKKAEKAAEVKRRAVTFRASTRQSRSSSRKEGGYPPARLLWRLPARQQSLRTHCALTAPSLHPHCTLTAPSPHPHRTLTAPSPHPHCTLTAPSLHPHCTLTAPSLHPHCALPVPGQLPLPLPLPLPSPSPLPLPLPLPLPSPGRPLPSRPPSRWLPPPTPSVRRASTCARPAPCICCHGEGAVRAR
jgi:hypothetical protein